MFTLNVFHDPVYPGIGSRLEGSLGVKMVTASTNKLLYL